MSKNKKNSRVGMGMKPRVQQEAAIGEVEPARAIEGMSATEGQYGGQIRGESAPSEPVETGGRLEEKPVQNLDSEKIAFVPADGFGEPPQRDPLEELMGKWPPEPGTYGAVERGTGDHTTPGLENLMTMVVDRASGAMGVFSPGADRDDRIDALLMAKLAHSDGALTLGQRGDGTFGLVVTIPEGLIEPIRGQAESDGLSSEEWVSVRLNEYLESWWSAPKGR